MLEKEPNKKKVEKGKASNYIGINALHNVSDKWEEDEVNTLEENRYQLYVSKNKKPIGQSETSELVVGVEFSNNDSDWNNNLSCEAKM
ncbi:45608_t:CDS:2 [Gigaspora margarita]|uniref:45608_t:CDS:1 n=1 Tax=Gigaspora margarita TaxID=4874 RepID=A0ABN7UBE6_GIGMA|nr:45608_t:CDS:2 [Gigaspora margarita]